MTTIEIEVSVRDAKKAAELFNDNPNWKQQGGRQTTTNSFAFENEDYTEAWEVAEEFEDMLNEQPLEVLSVTETTED